MFIFLENSIKIIQLFDSFIELDNRTNRFVQSIYVDESISSRRDAYLKISFSVQTKDSIVEINLFEPTGKKHQSKYNVKCRDSALFSYNSLEKTDLNQEIGVYNFQFYYSKNTVFLSFLKRERGRTMNVILLTFQTVHLVQYERFRSPNVPERF
jgi:hypothetical protein